VSDQTGSDLALEIRKMRPEDWPQVADIHAAGIGTGNATFETEPPTWPSWDCSHRDDLRLVGLVAGLVVGWAAAGGVSDRCCYAGVAEHSVYVRPGYQGRGIGRALLNALIDAATEAGVWTLQTGIFPENRSSLALHVACGFRVVGRREKLGQLNSVWRDVLLLERRSNLVGLPE
jgi:L-amino acid N-acyltransferase YncA